MQHPNFPFIMIYAKETTCLFTGHRTLPEEPEERAWLEKELTASIKNAYEEGYRTFFSGGAMGFDLLAALTVLNLKSSGLSDIRLILALPCYNHHKSWAKEDQRLLATILERADETVYTSLNEYLPGCMHKRNRFMADCSSLCIAYCIKQTGGSAYTVNYAQKHGVRTKWLLPI